MNLWLCRIGRAVVRVSAGGAVQSVPRVATEYLQGLVTNDIGHLYPPLRCLYSAFLNPKGRLLFDSLIYLQRKPDSDSNSNSDSYLLECDAALLQQFHKHLKTYRINRKIDVDVADKSVWALFDDRNLQIDKNIFKEHENIDIHIDPRTELMGIRILADASASAADILKYIDIPQVKECSENDYTKFRYKLGVPEGIENLPSSACFPLESNCDYLRGVSFQKGCYIGQELTARTYHTGVVRKRIMPLVFDREISIPDDTPIYASDNPETSIGKIRGSLQNVALGLLRTAEALSAPSLTVLGNSATTYKPAWWPSDKLNKI